MQRGHSATLDVADEQMTVLGQRLSGRRLRGLLGVLLAAVLLAAALAPQANAASSSCTDTFKGPTGGDWGTPANWSTGAPPTSNDVACWSAGTTVVVSTAGAATAKSIQGGDLSIVENTLTLTGAGTSNVGNFSESGGELDGPGSLGVSGNFSFTGGNIATATGSAMTITQTGSGTFSIGGSGNPDLGGATITTPSDVSITNLHFQSGNYSGLSSISTPGTVTFGPGTYYGGGSLTITASAFVTSGDTSPNVALHLKAGTASSSLSGTLTVPTLTTDAKTTLTAPAGGGITVGSGTLAGTITGPGTLTQNGYPSTTVSSGGVLSTANVAVTYGQLILAAGSTYNAATATTLTGGTLTLQTNSTTGDLTMSGGELDGPGSLGVSGNFSFTGGNIATASGSAIAITQSGSGTFSIGGSGYPNLGGATITTPSNVSITNLHFENGNYSSASTITTPGTVTFGPGSYNGGSALTVTASAFVTSGDTSPSVALHLKAGSASSSLSGTLTVPTLTTDAKTTLTAPAGGGISVGSGTLAGTITGPGTFTQNGYPSTTVSSGGTLSTANVAVTYGQLILAAGSTYNAATATTLTGGTLTLQTNSTTGDLTMSGGELDGPGSLGLSGNFSWTGGNIATASGGALAITQTGTGTFSIGGSGNPDLGGATITTPSDVSITNPHFENGNYSGLSSISTPGTVTFGPGSYYGGSALTITASAFVTSGDTSPNVALHLKAGTASSSLSGTLTVPTLMTDAKTTLTAPAGGGITVGAGTLAGTITGPGTFTQNGYPSTTIPSGGVLSTANVAVTYGQLILAAGSTYNAATATTLTGGTLTLQTNSTTGDLTMSGGELDGPGSLGLSGNFSWTGGNIATASGAAIAITQSGSGTFSIGGSGYPNLGGATITTPSNVSITNLHFENGNYSGASTITTPGTVTFGPGTYYGGSALTITAAGFNLSGDTSPNVSLSQSGGTTTIPSGTTLGVPSFALTGGTLNGSGTVSGSVSNAGGTVAPGNSPGTLSVSGNYSQTSTGTLRIAVNGTQAGQYSVLSVQGSVSLSGTLALIPSSQYAAAAAPGDSIALLPYTGSLTGTFSGTTVNPPLAGGSSFTPSYTSPSVVTAVVSGGAPIPTVSGVSPAAGPTTGGTKVTITGTNFVNGATVAFGANPATNVVVKSPTQITATSPGGNAGPVDVTVTTPSGPSAKNAPADQFTYVAAPTVTGVSPSSGPTGGTNTVTITGTNLTNASAVNFGNASGTSVTNVSATKLTVVAPAGTAGTVDVTVTTPGGTSAKNPPADQYTYTAAPTVTGVTPASGPTTGATNVTITGTNFVTGATTVAFGGNPATNAVVNSPTSITATSPAGNAGTVDVTVTTAGGPSAKNAPADQFTYVGAPTVTAVSPTSGPTTGATNVTITGTNFVTGATTVAFGANPATNVVVKSPTQITATSPGGNAGPVDVTVTTPSGPSAKNPPADQFTYTAVPAIPQPSVSGVSPSSGPTAGGTNVTITGTNLANASAVDFGSTPAAITSDGDSQITATAPPGSAGTVDVTVTTPGGTSPTSSADQFTYDPPPAVTPQPPAPKTTAAGFSGSIDPHGQVTTVHWEYGLDASQRGPGFNGNVFDQSTPDQVLTPGSTTQDVSTSVTNLVPNALYDVRLVASNNAGTTVSQSQTFKTLKAPDPPAPVVGQTENVSPVGSVFILVNGKFVPLTQTQQIPSGTVIDTLHGSINLVAATGTKGQKFTGTFGGAVFKVSQGRSGPIKGLTTLTLVEGTVAGTPSALSCKAGHAADPTQTAQAARLSSRILQTLRGRDRGGRFRTVGRYSAATVRGTVWDTTDRCDGTLTTVHQGLVTVTDFHHHKTITLHAGQSYLAKAA